MQDVGTSLSRVLPLETLRHVTDLSVDCCCAPSLLEQLFLEEPEWQAYWSQAPSVTKLVLKTASLYNYIPPCAHWRWGACGSWRSP